MSLGLESTFLSTIMVSGVNLFWKKAAWLPVGTLIAYVTEQLFPPRSVWIHYVIDDTLCRSRGGVSNVTTLHTEILFPGSWFGIGYERNNFLFIGAANVYITENILTFICGFVRAALFSAHKSWICDIEKGARHISLPYSFIRPWEWKTMKVKWMSLVYSLIRGPPEYK